MLQKKLQKGQFKKLQEQPETELVVKLLISDMLITSISKKSSNNNSDSVELTTHRKRYIFPEERQQISNELRLVPKNMSIFKNY